MHDALKIGLLQMAPGASVAANLAEIGRLCSGASFELAVVPENGLYWGASEAVSEEARESADWEALLGDACRSWGKAVIFGGIPVLEGAGVRNASLFFDESGALLARYDKVHLFQLFRSDAEAVDETRTYAKGVAAAATVDWRGWRIGLSICYDLRFPELYRAMGICDLMLCTAAFTRHTGRAHWEVLARARAIENQCWFAAAGICGRNAVTGHESWGHSMIIDPWGKPIAAAADEATVVTATLDKSTLIATRKKLPALQSRRL